MKSKVLITICGRAGSQGFKNKNLKTFLGKPLVYYSLSAAELFCEQVKDIADVDICLNTDSDELTSLVAEKYPEISFIKRDPSLGESSVPKAAVWHNCIDVLQERKNTSYKYLIDLDITSPLRQAEDVFNAFMLKLERTDADLVESMCPSRRNPYFNMMKEDGDFVSTVIDCAYTTRQQAPAIYDENASIYVINTSFFETSGDMLNLAKTVPYLMKDTAVLDIDSEEDFVMMEVIGNYLYTNIPSFKRIRDNIRK